METRTANHEWEPQKLTCTPQIVECKASGEERDINDLPRDLIGHARALTNQLLQEMSKGLLQGIRDRITSSPSTPPMKLVFWTTSEASDRCLRVFFKIGGIHEKRRARAIFCLGSDDPQTDILIEDAEREHWKDSRFLLRFIHSYIPNTLAHRPPSYEFGTSRKGPKYLILGFPWRRFPQTSSRKKLSLIHEHCLTSLLILTPTTPPHCLQQWTAGARRSNGQQ
jgi:hypothetical protein